MNFGTYELQTIEPISGFTNYYYFTSWQTIRNCKELTNAYPDTIRLLVVDREETPVSIRFINNPVEYIYKKYIKHPLSFPFGSRINWKKEYKKELKKTLDK